MPTMRPHELDVEQDLSIAVPVAKSLASVHLDNWILYQPTAELPGALDALGAIHADAEGPLDHALPTDCAIYPVPLAELASCLVRRQGHVNPLAGSIPIVIIRSSRTPTNRARPS
jgi:hypothetical protein